MASPEQERPGVPSRAVSALMFDNDHTCCICREKDKDVQIHHIDNDNTNNLPRNLAVLCLDCHSKVTGPRGLGRAFSRDEVGKYKQDWESIVKKRRRALVGLRPQLRGVELDLLRFEARGQVYQLAATQSLEKAKEILEFLDILQILDGDAQYILERLHWVAPFIKHPKTTAMIAEYVLHYFWGLPGPEHVKVMKTDIIRLEKALDLIVWMGQLESWTRATPHTMESFAKTLHGLFDIAEAYKLSGLKKKILQGVGKIKKEVSRINPETLGTLPVLDAAEEDFRKKLGT